MSERRKRFVAMQPRRAHLHSVNVPPFRTKFIVGEVERLYHHGRSCLHISRRNQGWRTTPRRQKNFASAAVSREEVPLA